MWGEVWQSCHTLQLEFFACFNFNRSSTRAFGAFPDLLQRIEGLVMLAVVTAGGIGLETTFTMTHGAINAFITHAAFLSDSDETPTNLFWDSESCRVTKANP